MTDDPQWLEWRRAGITATDVADAAAGTYGGAYAVVAKKLERVPAVEETEPMARGHRWQPVVADAVHVLTGLYVVGEEYQAECPTDPRWRATIDGALADAPEVFDLTECLADLEIKTVGLDVRPNRDRWRAQIQWQLLVTGLPVGLLVEARIDDVDDRCLGLRLEWIDPDPLQQLDLIEHAEHLWAHVQAGTLPIPGPGSLDTVKAVHAVAVPGLDVVALDDLEGLLERRDKLRELITSAEGEIESIDGRLIGRLDEATKGATSSGWRVSYGEPPWTLTRDREAELLESHPQYAKTVLDRAAVKADDPELYEAFRVRAGKRSLRVTRPKG